MTSPTGPQLLDPAVPELRVLALGPGGWADALEAGSFDENGASVVLALPLDRAGALDGPVGDALTAAGIDPSAVPTTLRLSGRPGEVVLVPAGAAPVPPARPGGGAPRVETVALYGTGLDESAGSGQPAPVLGGRADLAAGAALGRAVRGRGEVTVLLPSATLSEAGRDAGSGTGPAPDPAPGSAPDSAPGSAPDSAPDSALDLGRFVEGLVLGGYAAPRWGRPAPVSEGPAARMTLLLPPAQDGDGDRGVRAAGVAAAETAAATALARATATMRPQPGIRPVQPQDA